MDNPPVANSSVFAAGRGTCPPAGEATVVPLWGKGLFVPIQRRPAYRPVQVPLGKTVPFAGGRGLPPPAAEGFFPCPPEASSVFHSDRRRPIFHLAPRPSSASFRYKRPPVWRGTFSRPAAALLGPGTWQERVGGPGGGGHRPPGQEHCC
ncbi:hypothetical protein NY78_1683 [Desulfovibrio sp. TomC]|nr:hypothetical protein NY78_1683 [Desulfovibrio sp. TomC]